MTTVRYHLLDTGYCTAAERNVIAGGRRQVMQWHALAALIEHPTQGWLLWDTGYAPHMFDATARWPERAYRLLVPMYCTPEQAVLQQLSRFGLQASDIGQVIISHFHGDHVAGLRDFPQAIFRADQAATDEVLRHRGLNALRRGLLPALLPDDFAERVRPLPLTRRDHPLLSAFGAVHDLFGDGSLCCVALPGHARGQIGLLAQTEHRPIFLIADGAWCRRAIRERRPPPWHANLIADNPAELRRTLARLHTFAQAHPAVRIIPTHCPEVYAGEAAR